MLFQIFCLRIKKLITQNTTILFFIILLAYILRILPYLLGYDIPYTEDSLRDFQQVKYILDHHQINFYTSYQNYGSFPLLHLLVVVVSRLGLAPLSVFLFLPQLLASLGLIFYYIFLKKYFTIKQSLWACFFIAVFIPHIHWSAQPVRETLGLFFFPLIIYLFDQVITTSNKKILYLSLLIGAFILIVPTHHWSALMTLVWLIAFSLFFTKNLKQFIYATGLIIIFIFLNLLYWYFLFPLFFELISNLYRHLNITQIIVVAGLSITLIMFRLLNLNQLKKSEHQRNVFLMLLILLWLINKNILPLIYPPQIWLDFIIFLFFIFIGFFKSRHKYLDKFLALAIFYSFFMLMVLALNTFKNINIYSLPFDPLRTFEFAIFPLAILGAYGLLTITNNKIWLNSIVVLIMIILATFTYPPIFIYKNNFINTPFYDIRSNIRYISADEMVLIKWANDHNYNVESNRPEIRSYQATFYKLQNQKITLVTKSDNILLAKYNYIRDPIIRVNTAIKNNIDDQQIIYQNEAGYLFELQYNAKFLTHQIPKILVVGSKINITIDMLNTGSKAWNITDNYLLKSANDDVVLKLTHNTLPGEIGTFSEDVVIPNALGIFNLTFRIYKTGVGFFGASTPPIAVTIQK